MRKFFFIIAVILTFQLSTFNFSAPMGHRGETSPLWGGQLAYAAGLPYKFAGKGFLGGITIGGTDASLQGVSLDKNMVNNPSFEGGVSPPTGWSFNPGTGLGSAWSLVSDVVHSGSYAIKHTCAGTGDAFAATPEYALADIPCVPGGSVFVSFWIKTQGASANPRIRVIWFSKAGVYTGEGYYNSSGLISGTTDWTYSSGTASPPAGAYFMSFRCQDPGTGTVWFDDAYIKDLSTPIFRSSGYYESPYYDNGRITTFGKISWVADVPGGCSITLKTRTSTDGATWDHPDWSTAPVYSVLNSVITNTPGRYIQFRTDLSTPNRSISPLLKEVEITSALKGVGSPSGCVMKPDGQLVLCFDFNVEMGTNNGNCVATLIDGNNLQTVVSPGDGTWVDSQHFQTLPYAMTGIAGGFASLEITGPNVLGGTGSFYNYASNVLLIDAAAINPLTAQFFPNPFSPNGDGKADQATLLLMLSSPKAITVKIYDLKGRLVKILVENRIGMGEGIVWDGTDEMGRICPVGLYVYQIRMDNEFKNGTVVLAK